MTMINKDIASLIRTLSQTADDHPSMPLLLSCLGRSHKKRFDLLHEPEDLEKAIEYTTITLTFTPDNDPRLAELLFALAEMYSKRFLRLGHLCDIEKAIEYGRISVALTIDGDSDFATRYANLGLAHRIRFGNLGELNDVEDAIQYEARAVTLTPDGDPNLPGRLANLGASHKVRFEHLGELNDLEKAIDYTTQALTLASDSHPHLTNILGNLGIAYRRRFERQEELGDIESAVEYHSCALALTPDGHPDLSSKLANLGVSHRVRFERLSDLSDLDKAIEYQSRAIALTPDEDPDLPGSLGNLGSSYKNRFEQLGDLGDLDQAIKFESRALALAPDDHPYASKWQFNQANTHYLYYHQTRDHAHLQHSFDLFRVASQSLSGAPRVRFRIAQSWASIASRHDLRNCMEAYQTAMDLLPQFIWLGATTNQRYQDLSMTEALAVNAASAAIRSSDYSLALEWLEHARCVVWNQSLMLRSPLDELQSVHPELGTRLETVANQLHNAGSDSRESRALASGSMSAEQVAREHRQLAKEYDELLVRVRQLPGFEDFLRPMKAKRLIRAARTGPIVVINCHMGGCDALLVIPGEETVRHVPLPNFSAQKAQEARQALESSLRSKGIRERGVKIRQEPSYKDDKSSVLATLWHNFVKPIFSGQKVQQVRETLEGCSLSGKGTSERGVKVRQEPGHTVDMSNVLATLWHHVVKPILGYLGYMNSDSSDALPHITWCPTGALSFLPLHAAGDYDQPRSRVFDYVVSSYTPTLTALLTSAPSLLSTRCRVLAVGQANTPGHSALPGTARELTYVQTHTSNHSQYSQLMNSQATVTAVLDAMEQHDWVHLACHAHQNVTDPTKSGFFLHDGTLDLVEINRRSFKGKGLAFLSACQTATGDERLADEAVHLASRMLMAGYSSVIATMWSVHDEDAPLVANEVYAQLMKDKRIGNGEAGRALHNAVATLRKTVGEQKFERWVPYIHIGS